MKPLELTVYPRDEDGDYIHPYNEYCIPEIDIDYWTECKRLTSAELAAEYWAAHGDANALMTGNPKLLFSKRQTLKRFATLPHYDEESA